MRWYRSLYARVAVGSVAFLATMLVVQAVLFVWLVAQSGRTLPGEPPARLAMNVATDLSNVLDANPNINLAQYVKDQYALYAHPFFVMLTDGTLITSGSRTFPEALLRAARARIQRRTPFSIRYTSGPLPFTNLLHSFKCSIASRNWRISGVWYESPFGELAKAILFTNGIPRLAWSISSPRAFESHPPWETSAAR